MARTQRRRLAEGAGPASATGTRSNLPRPRQALPSSAAEGLSRPAPAQARRRRNPFGFLSRLQPRFVADVIAELRKVTWPSFSEVRYLTFVVAIVAIAVGALLGGLDLLFGWIMEQLFF
jgi:preprotein translocase subunit SecE